MAILAFVKSENVFLKIMEGNGENLLDEEATMRFLKQYEDSDDTEVRDAILQYYQEQFGTGSPEDQ